MSDADGICGFPDSAYPVFFVKEVAREREHAVATKPRRASSMGASSLHCWTTTSTVLADCGAPRDGWVAATNRMFVPGRNNWFPNGAVTQGSHR